MTVFGIDVAHPAFLALAILLVPVLAAFYFHAFRSKDRVMARFARPALFRRLMPDVSRPRQVLKAVFVVVAVAAVLVALARPRYGYEWEDIERKGVDIVVVLDLSTSMLAADVEPNRLERAKRELSDLLGMLDGDRLGLVAFAGTAFVQCPLTVDYRAYQLFLDNLDPRMMPVQGTDLGAAIATAVQTFDEEKLSSKAIILISDGEDNEGRGLEAAQQANELGVKIFAIGVGGEDPAPVPDLQRGGNRRDKVTGEVILTRFDEEGLKRIALATGGGYERSTTGDMDLDAIYGQDIKQGMEAYEIATSRSQNWRERFQWPLGLALILLVLESLLPEVRRRRNTLVWILLASIGLSLPGPAAAAWRNPFAPSPLRQGQHAYESGEYEQALQHFHAAQLDRPDDRQLEFNIADVYFRMEDYEAAELSLGRVLSLGEGEDDLAQQAHYNLGNTLYYQGRLEEAVTSYERAVEIDPDDEDARHNLEYVKQELERRKQEAEQQRKQREEQRKQQPPQQKQQQEEKQQQQQQQSAEQAEEQEAQEQEMINVDPTREADEDEPSVEGPPPVQLTPEEAERLLDALDERRPDNMRPQRRKQKEKDW